MSEDKLSENQKSLVEKLIRIEMDKYRAVYIKGYDLEALQKQAQELYEKLGFDDE